MLCKRVLVITEKPSVARDVASALGLKFRGDRYEGTFDGALYVVVWAAGHLYEIDNEKLVPAKPKWEDLPLVPERFVYVPRRGAGKLISAVRKALREADCVVIATDAGREGELIARILLRQLGWKRWDATFRFWTSEALTPSVVRKTMRRLRRASEFDSLYYEALARQHADWEFGMNASIAASLKTGQRNVSIGRVQTPVLKMIVDRYLEHSSFVKKPYWLVKAKCRGSEFTATWFRPGRGQPGSGQSEGSEDEPAGARLFSERDADAVLADLSGTDRLLVKRYDERTVRTPPPPLHSLTTLQREANSEYGFTAQYTLTLAQNLYEKHKCLSYPRTDSQYLGKNNEDLVREVLVNLGHEDLVEAVRKVGRRVFDDSKLTDHHALIPLAPCPPNADEDEKKVYRLVYRRFVSAFMPPEVRVKSEAVLVDPAGKHHFRAKGNRVVDCGWRQPELYGKPEEVYLPHLKEGQEVALLKAWKEKKYTQPPPLYTEGAVLKLMEKNDLGTPATRASIIETLKKRKYVYVSKGKLVPTQRGLDLVKYLGDKEFASPEMTAKWERSLSNIRKRGLGYAGYRDFVKGIVEFTARTVQEIKNSDLKLAPEHKLKKTFRRRRGGRGRR